jgi:hypothetical protein
MGEGVGRRGGRGEGGGWRVEGEGSEEGELGEGEGEGGECGGWRGAGAGCVCGLDATGLWLTSSSNGPSVVLWETHLREAEGAKMGGRVPKKLLLERSRY